MMVEWMRIADVLELQRRGVDVDPKREYQEIGVRSFGRGLFIKDPLTGVELGDKRVFEIRRGDLVVSNVFAWEGAVGLATDKHDGLIGSHRFMTWMPSGGAASARYLQSYFHSKRGVEQLSSASPGSAGRNRTLSINAFQRLLVPIPPRAEQDRITGYLDSLELQASNAARVADPVLLAGSLPRLLGDVLRLQAAPTVELGELAANHQVVIHPGDNLRGAEAFIGLEHIESHTGKATDGRPIENETGRKLLFTPGEVTYGYLRPYLNKAWVADRVGLCSVEQFVLQPTVGVNPHLLSVALRSDFVWDNARAATNALQLPRLSVKKLLAFKVPDVRLLDDPTVVLNSASRVTNLVADIDALRAHRSSVGSSILPAARNEIFAAMR